MLKKKTWSVLLLFILFITACTLEGNLGGDTSYTVSFDKNGGNGDSPRSQVVKSSSSIKLPSGDGLSKSGFTFGSWNTEPSGNGRDYSTGSFYTPTTNITLYAKWIPLAAPTYTIIFDVNGASGVAPASISAKSGSSITLPEQGGLSKSGYSFSGWNTNVTGTGSTYKSGSSYTVTKDITLYAKWSEDNGTVPTNPTGTTYVIMFSSNGGSGPVPSTQVVKAGSSITIPSDNGIFRSGYSFGGWNTNSSGTGANYLPGTLFTPSSEIMFYAKWESNAVYTVTFDINGGKGTVPAAQTIKAGSSITLPSDSGFTKNGYTFVGWNTQADGVGNNYSSGSTFTVTGNITLYANGGLAEGNGTLRLVNPGGYWIIQVYILKWDSSEVAMSDEKPIKAYSDYHEYTLPSRYYKIVINDDYGGPYYYRKNVTSQKITIIAGATKVVQYDTNTGRYLYP